MWRLPTSFGQNRQIAPGDTRTGILHFEIGGSDGSYLKSQGAGDIDIQPSKQPGADGRVRVGVIHFTTG